MLTLLSFTNSLEAASLMSKHGIQPAHPASHTLSLADFFLSSIDAGVDPGNSAPPTLSLGPALETQHQGELLGSLPVCTC